MEKQPRRADSKEPGQKLSLRISGSKIGHHVRKVPEYPDARVPGCPEKRAERQKRIPGSPMISGLEISRGYDKDKEVTECGLQYAMMKRKSAPCSRKR